MNTGRDFFRGVMYAMVFAIPVWGAFLWVADAIWRHVR